MNKTYIDAATEGVLLKIQVFETERGKYLLSFRRYKGDVYLFKYKDGKLVEQNNLSRMPKRSVQFD